jgi:hypothetical protein
MVDDARDLVRGLGIEALRCFVLALCGQLLKQEGRVSLGVVGMGAGRFLHG